MPWPLTNCRSAAFGATTLIAPFGGGSGRQRGPGLAVRAEGTIWSVVKGAALVATSAWAIRSGWSDILRFGGLEVPTLAPRRAYCAPAGLDACYGTFCFWDWSTLGCGTADSSRCCAPRPRNSAKTSA